MAPQTRPEPGRPIVTARQAAALLRRDVRTVRRMIQDGELEGGAQQRDKQQRWFVYLDQLDTRGARPAAAAGATAAQLDELQAEVADLRAQVVSSNETSRLLLAAHATILAAVEEYRAGGEEIQTICDGYRSAADAYRQTSEGYRRASGNFQASSDRLSEALTQYRDIVAQVTTPGNLSGLEIR